MKIGLLGCYGFIGSHVFRRLAEAGLDVVGIDRYASVPPWREGIVPPSSTSVCGDLLEPELVRKHLVDVELIFFAAGNPKPASTSFNLLFGEELRIMADILSFIVEKNRKARLVFVSSGGTVYGRSPHGTLSLEESPLDPISMYGAMKLACEKVIMVYAAQHGLESTILRVSNLYGPGQNSGGSQGLIPVVLRKIILDEEIRIWGDGSACRDYIFIDDFSDLAESLVTDPTASGVFNVGSGQGTSSKEILKIASRIAGREPKVKFLETRSQDLAWNALSIAKVAGHLAWTPKVSLEAGIRKTYDWLRTQQDCREIE